MSGVSLPRILIGAMQSGAGKTTLTCGILQAFLNRGFRACAFKCGPDYIDPLFHTRVIGAKSRNLDLFFCGEETVRGLLQKHARGQQIAVLEGAMGYYDGVGGTTVQASAYDLARATDTPAILVADAKGMSLTLAAALTGLAEFRADSNIGGVIFNRCAPSLYPVLKRAIEENTQIKPLGFLPDMPDVAFESRHLGLVTAGEIRELREKLNLLAAQCEKTVDIDGLLAVASEAPALFAPGLPSPRAVKAEPLIAVADDEAFCFHYEDNYDLLRACGVKLVFFSPLRDESLPGGIHGIILPGGYPELHAQRLSQNVLMRESVRAAIQAGMPAIAECGGFLYLHDELGDMDGQSFQMTGVIGGCAKRNRRMGHFGYVTLTARRDNVLCRAGESIRGHEFHYWQSDNEGGDCTLEKPVTGASWAGVHASKSLWTGFAHIYFYANPRFAENFAAACARFAAGAEVH